MKQVWMKGLPKLKELLYKLDKLMQIYVPNVYNSLLKNQIPSEIFNVQWFLTIFSFDFDPNTLIKVWDIFLVRRWKFVFQLSISILRHISKKVKNLNCIEFAEYLKSGIAKNKIPKVEFFHYH